VIVTGAGFTSAGGTRQEAGKGEPRIELSPGTRGSFSRAVGRWGKNLREGSIQELKWGGDWHQKTLLGKRMKGQGAFSGAPEKKQRGGHYLIRGRTCKRGGLKKKTFGVQEDGEKRKKRQVLYHEGKEWAHRGEKFSHAGGGGKKPSWKRKSGGDSFLVTNRGACNSSKTGRTPRKWKPQKQRAADVTA